MIDDAGLAFVDTNIFVYALASDDPKRSDVAGGLINELMRQNVLRTSTQVLQELYVTLTRKVAVRFSPERAIMNLEWIATWPVEPTDYSLVRAAAELSIAAQLSMWDALIVVAAARSGADRLYTEDLNHGQTVLGVLIVNPFQG